MEYLVVRRYQNPVERSLQRLAQQPGADRNRRIPTAKTNGSTPAAATPSERQTTGLDVRGLSQGFRERDGREIHSSGAGSSAGRRPATPRGSFSIRANGAGSSAETEDDGSRLHDGLSGSSLVDGEDDDGTVALLRNLWEKNPDLSASQD